MIEIIQLVIDIFKGIGSWKKNNDLKSVEVQIKPLFFKDPDEFTSIMILGILEKYPLDQILGNIKNINSDLDDLVDLITNLNSGFVQNDPRWNEKKTRLVQEICFIEARSENPELFLQYVTDKRSKMIISEKSVILPKESAENSSDNYFHTIFTQFSTPSTIQSIFKELDKKIKVISPLIYINVAKTMLTYYGPTNKLFLRVDLQQKGVKIRFKKIKNKILEVASDEPADSLYTVREISELSFIEPFLKEAYKKFNPD